MKGNQWPHVFSTWLNTINVSDISLSEDVLPVSEIDFSGLNYASKEDQRVLINRVVHNILHYACWQGSVEKMKAFLLDMGRLSTEEITRFRLEEKIVTVHDVYVDYVNSVSESLVLANMFIGHIFSSRPDYLLNIAEDIYPSLIKINEKIVGVLERNKILGASAKGKSSKIKKVMQPMIAALESVSTMIGPISNEAPNALEKIGAFKDRIAESKDLAVADINGLLNNRDFEKKWDDCCSKINDFYIAGKLEIRRLQTEVIGSHDHQDNEVVLRLMMINEANKCANKIKISFIDELVWWLSMIVLLSAIGCLVYFALELHIKPLHLIFALSVVVVAVAGLFVRNFIQQRDIKAAYLQQNLSRDSQDLNVATTISMSEIPVSETNPGVTATLHF
jgi:hypothetical protein